MDRRDDRGSDRRDDRGSDRRQGSSEKTVAAEERGKSPRPEGEKSMPKVEEPKPVRVGLKKQQLIFIHNVWIRGR